MKKIHLYSILAAPVILTTASLIRISSNKPPVEEMEDSRKAIALAKLQGAQIYGGRDFELALLEYDSAMMAWNTENNSFILFRDYSRVRALGIRSREHAERSILSAGHDRSRVSMMLERRMGEIEQDIQEFTSWYGNFPFDAVSQHALVRAKMQFMEGSQAVGNGNWSQAESMFDSAAMVIDRLHTEYRELLEEYFTGHQEWIRWIEQTMAFSRKNRVPCVIIDKMARKCTLYLNGKAIHAFSVELGSNWMGDKTMQGDKSTPEGIYRVTDRKSGKQTRYYKALLLDYPNAEDKKRFETNKKKSIIGKDAKIGGLIEIHGNGGKGVDWTDGCIALKDDEMDQLFNACTVGTRVTIVGSTRPLEQFYSN